MLPLADTIRSYSFPLVNWLLIGANILVFLFEVSLGEQARELVEMFGLVPVRFLANPGPGEIATLFTSIFLHAGWLHLFSNMLALYICCIRRTSVRWRRVVGTCWWLYCWHDSRLVLHATTHPAPIY
jgi:membrane associated rhomboid family serine protease